MPERVLVGPTGVVKVGSPETVILLSMWRPLPLRKMAVPLFSASVPEPSAPLLPTAIVEPMPDTAVPPLYVLAPHNASAPPPARPHDPLFARLPPLAASPAMSLPMV